MDSHQQVHEGSIDGGGLIHLTDLAILLSGRFRNKNKWNEHNQLWINQVIGLIQMAFQSVIGSTLSLEAGDYGNTMGGSMSLNVGSVTQQKCKNKYN